MNDCIFTVYVQYILYIYIYHTMIQGKAKHSLCTSFFKTLHKSIEYIKQGKKSLQ